MSRTDLDAATLARSLRRMAGDGSIEWVMEPMQASVLLDIADLLAENAKLREELEQWHRLTAGIELPEYPITEFKPKDLERENAKLRELVAYMWTYDYAGHFSTLPEHMEHVDVVWQQMQLLGIEVGG